MPKWIVTLSGDMADLEALLDLGVGVTREGDAFVFRSPDLDGLDDASAVQWRAVERVEVFKGLSQMAVGDTKTRVINVGGLAREDAGCRDYFLICGAGEYRFQRARADLRGPRAHSSPYPMWAAIAEHAPAVEKAFGLLGAQPSPVNLYRIFR